MLKTLKFYKYQPLSEEKHFTFLQNYLNQKVWLVPLEQFNDPFEGKCNFIPFSPEYVLKNPSIFDNILKQHHLNGEPNLTSDELKKRLKSKDFKNSLKNNIKITEFKKHGALCLTTKNNNIPMWAYYGDNHHGYCVEFEIDFADLCKKTKISPTSIRNYINSINQGLEILSSKIHNYPQAFVFTKVRYSDKIPTVSYEDYMKLNNSYDFIKYFVKNSVGVKSNDWQHEDEYRLIANGNSEECGLLPLQGFVPFLRVTGIIIGYQMENKNRKHVYDLCEQKKIRIYNASCSNSNYKIIIKPHQELLHANNKTIVA